jgi:Zn finger protein HypA/HybF involved in hydrogenase expression
MAYCKLCGSVMVEGMAAKADKNMCKRCYSDMTRYRRWQTQEEPLNVIQTSETLRLEKMFKSNMAAGRYVPRCFIKEPVDVECETCDKVYKTSTGLKLCKECSKREQIYIKLVEQESKVSGRSVAIVVIRDRAEYAARKRVALQRYEAMYTDLHSNGKRVPQAFLRRLDGGV